MQIGRAGAAEAESVGERGAAVGGAAAAGAAEGGGAAEPAGGAPQHEAVPVVPDGHRQDGGLQQDGVRQLRHLLLLPLQPRHQRLQALRVSKQTPTPPIRSPSPIRRAAYSFRLPFLASSQQRGVRAVRARRQGEAPGAAGAGGQPGPGRGRRDRGAWVDAGAQVHVPHLRRQAHQGEQRRFRHC